MIEFPAGLLKEGRGCLWGLSSKSQLKGSSSFLQPPQYGYRISGSTVILHSFIIQRNIDFNTVNIHRTVGMYFLVSTGNRGDFE